MSAGTLTLAVVLALAAQPECNGGARIEPSRLAAVAERESGFDPLIIHANDTNQVFHPANRAAAIDLAGDLIAHGQSIDLGLMQINNAQLRGLSLAGAFDACANMAAGAAHLRSDFDAVWAMAHRRYNCGRVDCSAPYAAAIQETKDEIDLRSDSGALRVPSSQTDTEHSSGSGADDIAAGAGLPHHESGAEIEAPSQPDAKPDGDSGVIPPAVVPQAALKTADPRGAEPVVLESLEMTRED